MRDLDRDRSMTMRPDSAGGPVAIGWAAVVIGILAAVHFAARVTGGPYGVDASFYAQVARHVMRGEGLVTTASLYLQGWELPAKTAIYPLWPLLLGYAGRIFGLETAAALVPQALYVISLILLYVLSWKVCERLSANPAIHPAAPRIPHLITALFGVNELFFASTVHPYTEGLAFTMALASFVLLARSEGAHGAVIAAFAGMFASLSFLARAQMLWVAVGGAAAIAILSVRRRELRPALVAFCSGAALAVLPWILYLGHVPWFEAWTGRGTLSQRVELPAFPMYIDRGSFSGWLGDRLAALPVMFHVAHPNSFVRTFGIAALLVPAATVVFLWRNRRRQSRGEASSVVVVALAIAGCLFVANLTVYRATFFLEWLFGWRHGLPLIFLIVIAVPYLLRLEKRVLRAVVVAVLLVSIVTGSRNVYAFVRRPAPALSKAEIGMLQWLNAQPRPLTAITSNAQVLSAYTDTRLHWTDCTVSATTTEAMLQRLPIDVLIVYEREMGCPFIGPITKKFAPIAEFGSPGTRIFIVRRIAP